MSHSLCLAAPIKEGAGAPSLGFLGASIGPWIPQKLQIAFACPILPLLETPKGF